MNPRMRSHAYRALSLAFALAVGATHAAAQVPEDSTAFKSFRVIFWVQSVRRSVEFYRDSLGLPFISYVVGQARETARLQPSDPEPYVARFRVGDQELVLQGADGPVRAAGERYLFEVADARAYSMRLKGRGVPLRAIAGDSTFTLWFVVVDPDGRQLEFRQSGLTMRRSP
jgi:catechol 2,3-dioxygenase-like lactoylglutathione lyase family enzyme